MRPISRWAYVDPKVGPVGISWQPMGGTGVAPTNRHQLLPSTLSNWPSLVWPCPLHLYLSPPLHLPFLCRRLNLLSRTSLPAIMSDSKGRLSFFFFFYLLLKFLVWWSDGSVCTSHHVDVNSGLRFDVGSFFIGCRVMLFYETVWSSGFFVGWMVLRWKYCCDGELSFLSVNAWNGVCILEDTLLLSWYESMTQINLSLS